MSAKTRYWRVQWHNGGCFGSETYETEAAAKERAAELRRTLGDSESWREGITGVAVSEYTTEDREAMR